MTNNEPFTLYNPSIPRETNEFIPVEDLKQRLIEFYQLYNPSNARADQIEEYLKYARSKGVLALQIVLKQKYNCNLAEADASEAGWLRIRQKLEEFYAYHVGDKTERDLEKIFEFARTKGLLALDLKLKEIYNQSLSEFTSRGLYLWKQNWRSVLQEHHAESVTYELQRFYTVAQRMKRFGVPPSLDSLVEWAVKHSRSEVNEKLLKKYTFCLDDVKMVKGNTNEERKINLKTQLIEFYQKHDPAKLGPDSARSSNPKLSKNINSKRSVSSQNTSAFDEVEKISSEMLEIEKLSERGIIYLEELNEKLFSEYGEGLEDEDSAKIRRRLVVFYQEQKVNKSPASIEDIVRYAMKFGLDAMNEKLVLTYGRGIQIDDL